MLCAFILRLTPQEIVPLAHLLFEFGITDDDWIDLKLALEKQFNVTINDLDNLQQLKTVPDVIDYMKSISERLIAK